MLVLAGSQTKDATDGSVAPSQYKVNATDAASTLAQFDLTYGKSEKRINGGFVEPPAAPITGYIWNDADYDGVRDEDEEGVAGVRVRVEQYYWGPLTDAADAPYGWIATGAEILPAVTSDGVADSDNVHNLVKGQYYLEAQIGRAHV